MRSRVDELKALKSHALHPRGRRHCAAAADSRTDPFELPGSGRPLNLPAQRRLLGSLLNENSRLVDQLRAVMRELRAAELTSDKLRATLRLLQENG